MNEQENRDRLALAVKVARQRMYRTVDAARIVAGISRGAWDNVEKGKPVKEFTLGPIEEALNWEPGRALAILSGRDEEPVRPASELEHVREAARTARVAGVSRNEWVQAYDAAGEVRTA